MARQKSRGKHAAHHSDELVTAESYSRNRYGSQARSGSRSFSAQSRRVGKSGQSTYPDQTMRSSQSNYPADASMRSVKSIYPGNAPKERKNPWRIVFVVSLTVFVAALVGLGAIAFQYISQQRAYDDLEQYAAISDSENMALSDLAVDWDALRAINPDIVGWIYIPNSPINYPVVQGENNDEYLHQAFDGSTGWLASAGTIFLDSANAANFSDRNSAVYGHHMNDGSMFAALSDWQNNDEFNAHRDIYLLTPQGNYRLKSFALIKTTGDDALVQTAFANDESYQSYIQDKLDRSVVTQEGDVLSAADIKQSILFSTCEYSQNDGRAVLFAAVVETTVVNDPYVVGTTEGTTGLSANETIEMDAQYNNAAQLRDIAQA